MKYRLVGEDREVHPTKTIIRQIKAVAESAKRRSFAIRENILRGMRTSYSSRSDRQSITKMTTCCAKGKVQWVADAANSLIVYYWQPRLTWGTVLFAMRSGDDGRASLQT